MSYQHGGGICVARARAICPHDYRVALRSLGARYVVACVVFVVAAADVSYAAASLSVVSLVSLGVN